MSKFGFVCDARTSASAQSVSKCIPYLVNRMLYTFAIYFSLNLKLEIFATDPIRAAPIRWDRMKCQMQIELCIIF